jgi:hypothetical protein
LCICRRIKLIKDSSEAMKYFKMLSDFFKATEMVPEKNTFEDRYD